MIATRNKPDEAGRFRPAGGLFGSSPKRLWLAFLPIPALIALMAVVYFAVNSAVFYDPGWLILIANTIFVGVVCGIVAYIALRSYNATGRIQILLLGCGVLVFGIGGVIAAIVRHMPGGANLNVTIYNIGAFLGAVFHLTAGFILLIGVSPEAGSGRKKSWLVLGYGGSILFMAMISVATFKSLIPPFFIQGVGPTPIRQAVLGGADILFAFAFLIFMGTYLRNKEVFLYWYSCALALTAISLTAFYIQRSVGSPVGWVGRLSQYFGGIYFLISLVTAARSAETRKTSLDEVLTSSLSGAEEKFRALAEHTPDVIRRFDRGLRHIYVNPAGQRLYGRSAGDIIGKRVNQTGLHGPSGVEWEARILKVFQTGRPMEVEDTLPRGDGVGFYLSHCVPEYGPDGTVANVLVVSRDLTERKHAEEGLKLQNAILQGVNRILGSALHTATEEEFGKECLQVAEMITCSKFGFIGEIGPDGLSRFLAISNPGWEACRMYEKAGERRFLGSFAIHGIYGRVLKDGKGLIANDPATHPDRIGFPEGHPPVTAFLGVPLVRDGATVGIIAVGNREGGYRMEDQQALEALAPSFVGALARKRAEEKLRHTAGELKRSNEDLEQFSYAVSHDLQEPLRMINGFLGLLQERYKPQLDDRACKYINYSVEGTLRMSQLITDLMTYSRVERRAKEAQPTDANASLASALANLRGSINNTSAALTHDELPTVSADDTQLTQLFQNLIGNAIKFRRADRQCQVHVGVQRHEDHWVFYVRDNGIGIPQDAFTRIFTIFQRLHTREEYQGTGVGLAICKKIVERHGGRIWVESQPGQGSTFYFMLDS